MMKKEKSIGKMIKGHQLMKKELVDELLELLKSGFKINVTLDKAA